ncbi:amino acid/amide ABC transporter ATP-binding protein 2, HAAT family [Nitratireductor aquibiodomus]|uniref:Amino acid/amide ABC transporter ATP-binding protein 2, HAAT family n=1 Tax=Nitratireductor aquibiodomus TaxID=204799 RepID=A0A1H4M0A2_9HYPH|nr:ABC transporter ATP-binding protein [Nitratireductor aquibiodomus]SEB76441.1 amino acid/amide ABC transporter ATP-binding protein 2, HAAT family [Nitratireductor aquibiodomus]
MSALLTVQSLQVQYGAVNAVRGIDLEVREGEIIALLGANGAGKSSTLNALVGLAPASAGTITFRGQDVTGSASERFASLGMTLSPEGRRVFGTLSVQENLLMGAYSMRDKVEIKTAWERVFDLFPILRERREQFAGTLSGGQQQMLAVGRALMSNPRLLLLDEPSLGLAPKIVEQVFELITVLRKQGVTMVVVEQNVSMALEVADRGYVMASGRIAASGTAVELRNSDTLQAAYLGAD